MNKKLKSVLGYLARQVLMVMIVLILLNLYGKFKDYVSIKNAENLTMEQAAEILTDVKNSNAYWVKSAVIRMNREAEELYGDK